jgi:pimeloyl-ACP methyl ester carboxylesterase
MLLMAHDWGGAVAWDFAINRVRPIDRLVMCNMPHPATFVRALRTSRAQKKKSWYILFFQIPKLPEWLLGRNGADPIRRVFRDTATNPDQFPPEVLDVYANAAARPGALTAMINYYRAAARSRGRMAEVGDMRDDTRTLLIWGTGDTALGMETVDGIEDYVPNIRKEFLPGISHWVQQDAPAEVNALIADWLATQNAA